jgi:hypothetical protein
LTFNPLISLIYRTHLVTYRNMPRNKRAFQVDIPPEEDSAKAPEATLASEATAIAEAPGIPEATEVTPDQHVEDTPLAAPAGRWMELRKRKGPEHGFVEESRTR